MTATAKRTLIRANEIGPGEAQQLLEITSSMFHTLVREGRLPARMLDQRGAGFRRWIVKRANVLKLKAEGFRKYNKPKRRLQRALWERYFGAVPAGYTPVFRDGNRKNIRPDNLCLVAMAYRWKSAARGQRNSGPAPKVRWTREKIATLRREYAAALTADLARKIGKTVASVRMKARKLRLRKDMRVLRQQVSAHHGGKLPIGTERLHGHADTIYIKIADAGSYRQSWRPKHHVIWEQANGCPVPTRDIVFLDGDRRNFDPGNLQPMTREETSAYGNIRHQALPKELQQLIRLTTRLKQEVSNELLGISRKV